MSDPSQLLLDLYRAAREAAPVHFQDFVLQHVTPLLRAGGLNDRVRSTTVDAIVPDPAEPDDALSADARDSLLAHLTQALAINRELYLGASELRRDLSAAATAFVDKAGIVYHADARFQALLRKEWLHWDGRLLPSSLLPHLQTAREYRGDRIVVSIEPVGDLLILNARMACAIDTLTPRERDIAVRLAQGMSHKEIARALSLSPATVRNYIQTIYAKVGVNDKAAFATELARIA